MEWVRERVSGKARKELSCMHKSNFSAFTHKSQFSNEHNNNSSNNKKKQYIPPMCACALVVNERKSWPLIEFIKTQASLSFIRIFHLYSTHTYTDNHKVLKKVRMVLFFHQPNDQFSSRKLFNSLAFKYQNSHIHDRKPTLINCVKAWIILKRESSTWNKINDSYPFNDGNNEWIAGAGVADVIKFHIETTFLYLVFDQWTSHVHWSQCIFCCLKGLH